MRAFRSALKLRRCLDFIGPPVRRPGFYTLNTCPNFGEYLTTRKTEWCEYSKTPFGGPAQVLDYLGRYTHRVAISNHRLVKLEDGRVTFRWKDYAQGNRSRLMTLDAAEFIRRFLLHVLPSRFMRLRHYGLLGNRHRSQKLSLCRTLLNTTDSTNTVPLNPQDWKSCYEALTGESLDTCPACRQGHMVRVEVIVSPLRRRSCRRSQHRIHSP